MVAFTQIWRAVVSRFAATLALILGGALSARAITAPHDVHWITLGIGAVEGLGMSLGYAVVLLWLRRRLPAHAGLATWRSSAAALLAIVMLGVLSIFTQGATTATIAVLSTAAGAVSAALTWLPVLIRPPERRRTLDELEAEADAMLAQLEEGRDLTSPRRTAVKPETERFKLWRRVA